MDRLILQEKLEGLRRCIRRIQSRRASDARELQEDIDRQDIISLNLTRAVQLCVDMATMVITESDEPAPQTMGQSFDALARLGLLQQPLADRMKAAVGFRNIAVHNYQTIDWDIVHAISHGGLDDFQRFARAVANLL